MLTLLTFNPALGTHTPSPFTMKADALLAMSGLPYNREYGDLRKMPRNKLPVLRAGTTLIPDSAHIQSYLETEHGILFDDVLSAGDRSTAAAFRAMIEHHLYFLAMHFRWMEHGDAIKQAFFGQVPAILRGFIFDRVLKDVKKTLYLQGLGRHTRDELIEFQCRDLQALAIQLGDKPYLLGDRPTSVDASAYGLLHNLIDCELDTPGKSEAGRHENIFAYCDRFRQAVFHD